MGDVYVRNVIQIEENYYMRIRQANQELDEHIGVVIQCLGDRRFRIKCDDGLVRVGRVPNNKKFPFIRENYVVIVREWEVQSTTKCRIVYVYNKTTANRLRKII